MSFGFSVFFWPMFPFPFRAQRAAKRQGGVVAYDVRRDLQIAHLLNYRQALRRITSPLEVGPNWLDPRPLNKQKVLRPLVGFLKPANPQKVSPFC